MISKTLGQGDFYRFSYRYEAYRPPRNNTLPMIVKHPTAKLHQVLISSMVGVTDSNFVEVEFLQISYLS